jgi:hypothetical protein
VVVALPKIMLQNLAQPLVCIYSSMKPPSGHRISRTNVPVRVSAISRFEVLLAELGPVPSMACGLAVNLASGEANSAKKLSPALRPAQ